MCRVCFWLRVDEVIGINQTEEKKMVEKYKCRGRKRRTWRRNGIREGETSCWFEIPNTQLCLSGHTRTHTHALLRSPLGGSLTRARWSLLSLFYNPFFCHVHTKTAFLTPKKTELFKYALQSRYISKHQSCIVV